MGDAEEILVIDDSAATNCDSSDEELVDDTHDKVIIENTDVLSFDSLHSTTEVDDVSAIMIEKKDVVSCDDNWDVVSGVEQNVTTDSVHSKNDSEWDELSSMKSVQSIDTFRSEVPTLSYKEILAKKGSGLNNNGLEHKSGIQKGNTVSTKDKITLPKSMPAIVEDT